MIMLERFQSGNFAVHCRTEVQAYDFLSWCNDNGIIWASGESIDGYKNRYCYYENKTCYECKSGRLVFANLESCKNNDCKVIEFDDFMKTITGGSDMSDMFTLDDLKTGMRVYTRNGDEYVVMKDIETLYCGIGAFVSFDDCYVPISEYNNDLTFKNYNKKYDIVKVVKPKSGTCVLSRDKGHFDFVWEREEVKEMTVAEIIKALGYKVKIIE